MTRQIRRIVGTPPDLGPGSTFEALLDQRLKDLAAEMAEIKLRVNGLLFVIVGALIVDVALRLTR